MTEDRANLDPDPAVLDVDDRPKIMVTVLPSGDLSVDLDRIRSVNLWAASRLLQVIGDAMWTQTQARAAQQQAEIASVAAALQGAKGKIVMPGGRS